MPDRPYPGASPNFGYGGNAVKPYILTLHHSKLDFYGNSYHAFTCVCPSGKVVSATVSCDNAGGIPHQENGWATDTWDKWVVFNETLPIRKFNRLTKGWAHAGCTPEELWAFIQKESK